MSGAPGATIDDRPVPLLDWQAEVTADHGDRTLTGRVPRWVSWATEGAPIQLWRRAGDPLWTGELVAAPRIDGDWLHIRAEGLARRLGTEPLLYRLDGAAAFADQESDPHEFNAHQGFELTQGPGMIKIQWGNGDTFASGDHGGFIAWLERCLITRYSITGVQAPTISNFDLVVRTLDGPSGATTLIDTDALTAASATYANDINGTDQRDAIWIRVQANAASTPTTRRRFVARDIRLYGRTRLDTFTLSEVVADVAMLAGLTATGVATHGVNALPLYWPDQGHEALLTYMAELADWLWMVRNGDTVFRPYGARTWECSTDRGTVANLEPEPRYNRFTQPWRNLHGRLRYTTAEATVDPFPGQVRPAPLPDPLEDAQPDNLLATAVAKARMAYESSYRASGTVDLGELRYRGTARDQLELEVGDHLEVTDMPELGPQRITGLTYRREGVGSVTLGETFNMVAAMKTLERRARRRRRRERAA